MAGPWEDFQVAPPKGGPWEDFQQPVAAPSFTGDVAQQASEGWNKISEAVTQPDPGILPSRVPRILSGVSQIASAPIYAAGQRLERQFPVLKEAQENAQKNALVPLESPADVMNTAIGLGVPAARRAPGPVPTPPADVLLTRGQQTGDLAMIREEQAALRGQRGDPAQVRAEQFAEQQGQQVQGLKERIGQSFDQFGQNVATNPQDAAALAQSAVQRASQSAKADVNARYAQARQLGGEVDAGAFQGMGDQIRANLSSRAEPVIVDDQLTPWASKALSEVDKVGNLNIQNRAGLPPAIDPVTGKPMPVTGVNLEGIDQARKRLVQMRSGAYSSNATDGRATSAVLDAFDDHITQAINSGAFKGNPQAVQAWNDARAASAQFKQTFSAVKGDPVGQKIEKIIGRRGNDPLTPNDVADALYGKAGTDPGTANVGVANRVKNILGDQSPEWSAVKQGLWRRLVEKGEGQPEMEPGTIATRLMKFLNADGREMANAVYSPQEREMIKRFAELQRQLQPPPSTVNRSETSTLVVPVLKKIGTNMTAYMGFALAHGLGLGPIAEVLTGLVSGAGKEFLGNGLNARKISAQMPLATEAVAKFQKATAAYNKANSPPSRVALSVATTNLVRAFKPLGITFQGVLPTTDILPPTGGVPAAADQQSP
jgi:hypothetical protein